jgi:hypothetical protein
MIPSLFKELNPRRRVSVGISKPSRVELKCRKCNVDVILATNGYTDTLAASGAPGALWLGLATYSFTKEHRDFVDYGSRGTKFIFTTTAGVAVRFVPVKSVRLTFMD